MDITVISSEPDGFYNRIAVGALAVQKRVEAELFTLGTPLLEAERIHTRFGGDVTHIDVRNQNVQLADGSVLTYDRLILATGATPLMPPISGVNTDGVHCLWTMNDARKLASRLQSGNRVAVIGGGVLGVEAAMDIRDTGKTVHLIEAANSLMEHHLPGDISRALQTKLEQDGIAVSTRELVTGIQRKNGVLHIQCANRATISCDAVVVSTGVRPNIELAKAAGIDVQNGILVNDRMATSVPHILACGNCIEPPRGSALLWNPARRQGGIAGENAFAENRSFEHTLWPIHLKSNRISLFTMGDPHAIPEDATGYREILPNGQKQLHLTRDGKLCHVTFFGDVKGYHTVEKMFRNGTSLPVAEFNEKSVSDAITALSLPAEDAGYMKPGWVCNVCGYTHEGDVPPGVCPVCNVGRDQFLAA